MNVSDNSYQDMLQFLKQEVENPEAIENSDLLEKMSRLCLSSLFSDPVTGDSAQSGDSPSSSPKLTKSDDTVATSLKVASFQTKLEQFKEVVSHKKFEDIQTYNRFINHYNTTHPQGRLHTIELPEPLKKTLETVTQLEKTISRLEKSLEAFPDFEAGTIKESKETLAKVKKSILNSDVDSFQEGLHALTDVISNTSQTLNEMRSEIQGKLSVQVHEELLTLENHDVLPSNQEALSSWFKSTPLQEKTEEDITQELAIYKEAFSKAPEKTQGIIQSRIQFLENIQLTCSLLKDKGVSDPNYRVKLAVFSQAAFSKIIALEEKGGLQKLSSTMTGLGHRLIYDEDKHEISIKMNTQLGSGTFKTVMDGVYLQLDSSGKPEKVMLAAISSLAVPAKSEAEKSWARELPTTEAATGTGSAEFTSTSSYTSTKGVPKVRIIAPLYSAGTLGKVSQKNLSHDQKKFITRKILTTACELQQKGVINFDIKPANILVDEDKKAVNTNEQYIPYIADFGMGFQLKLKPNTDVNSEEFKKNPEQFFDYPPKTAPVLYGTAAMRSPDYAMILNNAVDCMRSDNWATGLSLLQFHGVIESPMELPWITGKCVSGFGGVNQVKMKPLVEKFCSVHMKPITTYEERESLGKEELMKQIALRMVLADTTERLNPFHALSLIEEYEQEGTL